MASIWKRQESFVSPMAKSPLEQRVAAVRHFNRFYTQKIGILNDGLLRSPFSLTEARLLYELTQRDQTTATILRKDLGLDAGYLSRLLRRFEKGGLIVRRSAPDDRRQSLLALTARGHRAFAPLDMRSRAEIRAMLNNLPAPDQVRLLAAMRSVGELLGAKPPADASNETAAYILRPPRPGDIGWVIHRHAAIYAREYGWDERFEALVAEIAAKFLRNYDAKRERCWIAEKDGEVVGSVFLVRHTGKTAKLRLLIVDPKTRGLGIGARLVTECVTFARDAGYDRITLWTQSVLRAARHIYQQAGFRLVSKERHHSFGHSLLGETWELEL
jgi:DNA-binding MarR family transcriptional regulator/GNAT superfamily N-acetyltransferase